jgi:hypothetical protein
MFEQLVLTFSCVYEIQISNIPKMCSPFLHTSDQVKYSEPLEFAKKEVSFVHF